MAEYYKPWLVGREPSRPAMPSHPLDKIRCNNGHRRYVVACMHNCPRTRYCREFWDFFRSRNILPPDYYNQDGIGDRAMRRIVFDCDRCGKKDIGEIYSAYRPEGEGPEFTVPEAQRRTMVESFGFAWDDLGPFVFHTLAHLEKERGWVHYCRRCFQQTSEWMAKICAVKANPALKEAAAARAAEAKGEELADGASQQMPLRVASSRTQGTKKKTVKKKGKQNVSPKRPLAATA